MANQPKDPVMESSGWISEQCLCAICGRSWREKLIRFKPFNETYIWCPFCKNLTGIAGRYGGNDETN